MTSTIKRYGTYGLIFLMGLLSGVGLYPLVTKGPDHHHAVQQIDPNTDIFSVLEEEIMSLTYHTETLTLTAQRSNPADQFAIQVTFADGRKPQQCLASSNMGGLLARLSRVTAKRKVQRQQFDIMFPRHLGILEIRDNILAEPLPPMEFRSTVDRRSIAVSYGDYAAETYTQIDVFDTLEAGCNALAQH